MEKTFKTPTHKYNKESLIVINNRYCGSHTIHDSDIDMANAYVNIIERKYFCFKCFKPCLQL